MMMATTTFISYGNLQGEKKGFLVVVLEGHVCASNLNTQQRTLSNGAHHPQLELHSCALV